MKKLYVTLFMTLLLPVMAAARPSESDAGANSNLKSISRAAEEDAAPTDRILVDEAGWSFRVLDGSEKLTRWLELYPWAFQGGTHYAELTGCSDNAGGQRGRRDIAH